MAIVSVLHQDEGGIGKSIPDGQKISRDPREGNLESVWMGLDGSPSGVSYANNILCVGIFVFSLQDANPMANSNHMLLYISTALNRKWEILKAG